MGKYGWICPRYGRVNAPWIDHCNCNNNDIPYPDWLGKDWWKDPLVWGKSDVAGTSTTSTKDSNGTNYFAQTNNTYNS